MPKAIVTPIKPRPTTNKPVTAPPRNAVRNAGSSPPRAASAVRTFERTEMFIPMYPAAAERTAPSTKRDDVFQPRFGSVSLRMRRASAIATTTPINAIIAYCRLRYADAPSWIACAISRIFSLPCGCRSTQPMSTRPQTSARTPASAIGKRIDFVTGLIPYEPTLQSESDGALSLVGRRIVAGPQGGRHPPIRARSRCVRGAGLRNPLEIASARTLSVIGNFVLDLLAFAKTVELNLGRLGPVKEDLVAVVALHEAVSAIEDDFLDLTSCHRRDSSWANA